MPTASSPKFISVVSSIASIIAMRSAYATAFSTLYKNQKKYLNLFLLHNMLLKSLLSSNSIALMLHSIAKVLVRGCRIQCVLLAFSYIFNIAT